MLQTVDILFTIFHTLLIGFNLTGWLFERWKKLHLVVISLTLASWFILGIWYGWGCCPLTDWHYSVLRQLGHENLPPSYITFLLARIYGVTFSDRLIELITVVLAFFAFIMSIKVNYFARENDIKNL